VAQPIFDKLRQRQRDALVGHVMHQHGFAAWAALRVLPDRSGMEPVVRPRAFVWRCISAVVIQRCANLEKQVHPSVINAKQWEG